MNHPTLHATAAQIAVRRLVQALAFLQAAYAQGDRSTLASAATSVEQARAELAPFLPSNQKHHAH
jgi:hypothetical protein